MSVPSSAANADCAATAPEVLFIWASRRRKIASRSSQDNSPMSASRPPSSGKPAFQAGCCCKCRAFGAAYRRGAGRAGDGAAGSGWVRRKEGDEVDEA